MKVQRRPESDVFIESDRLQADRCENRCPKYTIPESNFAVSCCTIPDGKVSPRHSQKHTATPTAARRSARLGVQVEVEIGRRNKRFLKAIPQLFASDVIYEVDKLIFLFFRFSFALIFYKAVIYFFLLVL